MGAGATAILDTNKHVAWVLMPPKKYLEIALDKPLPKPKPPEPIQLPPGSPLRTFTETKKTPLFPSELAKPALAGADAQPCAGEEGMTCRKVGSEALNGREADKWEVRKAGEAEPSLLWVDKRLRIVVRRESGDSLFELKNIQEGPQDASLFAVPADYQKMSVPGA